MTSNSSTDRVRTRAQRVASKVSYDGFHKRFRRAMESGGASKLIVVALTSLMMCVISDAWDPPFRYRKYIAPERDVVSRADFETRSTVSSAERQRIRAKTPRFYVNDPSVLIAYKNSLSHRMLQLVSAPDYNSLTSDDREFLSSFLPENAAENADAEAFKKFQDYFSEDADLARFSRALDNVFLPLEKKGVLRTLPTASDAPTPAVTLAKPIDSVSDEVKDIVSKLKTSDSDGTNAPDAEATLPEGSDVAANDDAQDDEENASDPALSANQVSVDAAAETIKVYYAGSSPAEAQDVEISSVMWGPATSVKEFLCENISDPEIVALVFRMIKRTIPQSLTKDYQATRKAQDDAVNKAGSVTVKYQSGDPLIRANSTIDVDELRLLRAEYKARLSYRTWRDRAPRFFAVFAMIFFLMGGAYFLFLNDLVSKELTRKRHSVGECVGYFTVMLLFFAFARVLQFSFRDNASNPEIVPLLLFVQLTSIASAWEVAVTFGSIMSFALVLANGGDVSTFLVFLGVSSASALLSRDVRARVDLVLVAVLTGALAFVLAVASGYVESASTRLGYESFLCGVWTFLAGFITSGVLPLFERWLGILTPMRLLEYSNPSHPLLQELNRRAPATYSHAIQTAALAEPAAETIGARSALVRVGAYFHDVGKMLQPEHFTENQNGYNIHDELEPRMSALVIVAHVKDGADLARRYQIPKQIVDLLEQHHGTMRVGQFYERAQKIALEQDPDAPPMDDAPFRYPGPIPQTKEAGILMLADALESASRSLTDWSPRRLENLVQKIVDARIEDGQFRESGLTLGELHTIEQSLVATLLASHHTRVKYDEKPTVKTEAKRASATSER